MDHGDVGAVLLLYHLHVGSRDAVQRQHGSRIIGSRISMGEAAADRSLVPHLDIADNGSRLSEEGRLFQDRL